MESDRYKHRRVPRLPDETGEGFRSDSLQVFLDALPEDEEFVSFAMVHRDLNGAQVDRYEVITRKAVRS